MGKLLSFLITGAAVLTFGAHAFAAQNYVGDIELYRASADDTMLTIGEKHRLGYVEIRSANPQSDPWKPGEGTMLILPKMHLFPDAPRKGIVVNLSEMRMYYFPENGEPVTHPIGVGREGFSTPMGNTTVTRKSVDPSWRPTPRMRREDPNLPAVVQGGTPENPLGTRALYLGWPAYLLHGTNKPWGIGRRVSSGCVRMYNSSVEELYDTVKVGTPVSVIRQPIKFGWIDDMLYIEAHPDEMLADQVERRGGQAADYKVPDDIFANLSKAAGAGGRERIDWNAVRTALRDRSGYPVPILKDATDDHHFVTESMQARAGAVRTKSRAQQRTAQGRPQSPVMRPPQAVQQTASGEEGGRVRRASGQFN